MSPYGGCILGEKYPIVVDLLTVSVSGTSNVTKRDFTLYTAIGRTFLFMNGLAG
jgi:hypothetical protein